jgi:transposase
MDQKDIFALALDLQGTPWYVSDIELDEAHQRLNIHLDFPPFSRFAHPESGEMLPVYDTLPRSWRHQNFFQYECYVHAFVPRVDGGPEGGKVKQVEVPWARSQSGFTGMMEAMVMLLVQTGMTVKEAARTLGEYPQRIWTLLFYHVDKAFQKMPLEGVVSLSVDELSKRRGHSYVSIFSEPAKPGQKARVLWVTAGRDSEVIGRFWEFLKSRGIDPKQIQTLCTDMNPAYIKGLKEKFPWAKIVFDYFHVVQLVTQAVDEVRRRERQSFPALLKGTRWLFLKGEEKLRPQELKQRQQLCRGKLHTGRACSHLEALRDIMKQPDPPAAESDLKWWCGWLARSRIPEMKAVAKTVRAHWEGIVEYLKTRITNGAAEALNGIIQTVKRKSRGFRRLEYFQAMIYLVASRLTFDHLPVPVPTTHTKSY